MTTVFISHSSADDRDVRAVVAGLERKGVSVWVDHAELSAGGDIGGRIEEGLERADAFLLLYSSSAATSPWAKQEWSAALSRHLETDERFPLLIGCLDSTRPPRVLQGMKTVDLSAELVRGLDELCQGLVTDRRPMVWYFDDVPSSLVSFQRVHGSAFRFQGFSDSSELLPALMSAQMTGSLPDVLLLDYYSAKRDLSAEQVDAANRAVERMLREEKVLKEQVDAAWRPAGVDVVDAVRAFYPPDVLPIAMHTQQGLVLLRDGLMQQLEYHNVGWIIKNHFSPDSDRLTITQIARQSGHIIRRDRPHVLIIDDNIAYIGSFIARQKQYYDIESLTSVDAVMSKLADLEMHDQMPDIFLVDMYYPTEGGDSESIDAANRKLAEFAVLESQTEQIVRASFEPIGLSLIRQIRAVLPPHQLPILVYSVSGLVTIDDRDFREVKNRGCGWLLKNRYDARTEEVMIIGEMMRAHTLGRGGAAR